MVNFWPFTVLICCKSVVSQKWTSVRLIFFFWSKRALGLWENTKGPGWMTDIQNHFKRNQMWCLVWDFLATISDKSPTGNTVPNFRHNSPYCFPARKPLWGESVRFNWGFNCVFCAWATLSAMKSKFYTDSFRWLSTLIMLLCPHSSTGITHNLVGFSGIWTLQQCKDVLIPAVRRQCCTYVTEFLHLFTQTGWHGDLEIAASIGNQSAGHYFGFSIPQLDSVETEEWK